MSGWRRTQFAFGRGMAADFHFDQNKFEKIIEDYTSNRELVLAGVRQEMLGMLEEAIGVIRDCMRNGTKDDVVRLKSAIWVLESEGIVKTEKHEFVNYDGNFADKAMLLDELKQELMRGETRRLEPSTVEAVVVSPEKTEVQDQPV